MTDVILTSDSLSKRSQFLAERATGGTHKALAAKYGVSQTLARVWCRKAVKAGLYTRFQLRVRDERPIFSDEEYDRRWLGRMQARTVVNERGCFIWQGPVGSKGYIMHPHRRWQNSGHRIVYRILRKKDLATSDLVCHECDTRRCWNIDHLFIGTEAVNNRDCGNKGRHHNSVKTHCKRGHEFTPENTGYKKGPGTVMRVCKECQRMRMSSEHYRQQAAERAKRKGQAKRLGEQHAG